MSKYTNLNDHISKLPADRRKRIDDNAKILCQSIELRKLRQSKSLNQKQLAKLMGVTQGSVSKIESGADIRISALQKYVSSLGGEVLITAKMPSGDIQLL